MDRKENWAFCAVVGAKNFDFFYRHASSVVVNSGEETVAVFETDLAGRRCKGVCVACLLVQVVRGAEKLVLLSQATLKFSQDLIVALASHDDLAVNVLDVHVFTTVRIGSH